ncbi:MAG: DUF2934 domain-containing protein [Candidatus Acidiferrum sp.]
MRLVFVYGRELEATMSNYQQAPNNDQIARKAYELYLDHGSQNGRDVEDWLNAEKELSRTSSESTWKTRSAAASEGQSPQQHDTVRKQSSTGTTRSH